MKITEKVFLVEKDKVPEVVLNWQHIKMAVKCLKIEREVLSIHSGDFTECMWQKPKFGKTDGWKF
jgi:hypothetical protein